MAAAEPYYFGRKGGIIVCYKRHTAYIYWTLNKFYIARANVTCLIFAENKNLKDCVIDFERLCEFDMKEN